jgi:hypothetical protein
MAKVEVDMTMMVEVAMARVVEVDMARVVEVDQTKVVEVAMAKVVIRGTEMVAPNRDPIHPRSTDLCGFSRKNT